jgi:hypothetical protein
VPAHRPGKNYHECHASPIVAGRCPDGSPVICADCALRGEARGQHADPAREAEAKAFWPLYEAYQQELHKINDRIAMTIVDYAKEFNANTLTDAKAAQLLQQSIAIEEAEIKLKRTFVPKLGKVLPGRKIARYIQIENKVRAIVKYEIAGEVPLAP